MYNAPLITWSLFLLKPARVSLRSGCEGVAAINTIMSVMGINLKTLHPEPCVEGLVYLDQQVFFMALEVEISAHLHINGSILIMF